MITIKSFQTKYLLKENIKKILEIKNENWKYGLNSQKKFFIKNILPDDYHVLLFFKKKLIGYTALSVLSKINFLTLFMIAAFIVFSVPIVFVL